ncbi:MAG: type VII secretion protein EccB, partial [Ornithinibacter sp.]
MATKKDLVEAQSFSRRRLTTAFVSGAPGGREVEPHRPLRAVAGGLALTVVLILGSMAFGWLRSSLPQGWENNRLVIAQDSGARYVSVKSVLHPVVNTTSARLLIPA